MKAAVLWERNTPLKVEELEIAEPIAGEAQVRLMASGVCHSDLHHIKRETWAKPPLVLGHEGAGIVEKVGPGVTRVKPGDHVIIAFGSRCGECFFCERGQPHLCATPMPQNVRLRKGDQVITPFLAVGSFAEFANVEARNLVVIPEEMPLDRASLMACGVATGIGAVVNTAKVEPGSNVVVIGMGGVGLNIIQGARLAGAAKIIAVDLLDNKLEMSRQFGASHLINSSREDVVEVVKGLTGGWGADYAFEAIGLPQTIQTAYDSVCKGGTAVIVGQSAEDAIVPINAVGMMRSGKRLMGCAYGSIRPHFDFKRLVNLYLTGRIMVDELISRRYDLTEVNDAFDAMQAGEVARGIIVY